MNAIIWTNFSGDRIGNDAQHGKFDRGAGLGQYHWSTARILCRHFLQTMLRITRSRADARAVLCPVQLLRRI